MEKYNITDNNFIKEQLGRRSFLKKVTKLLGGITLMSWGLLPLKGALAAIRGGNTGNKQEKLIFIAIDALHPKYFELDARGLPGGCEGNWLMPNIQAFLKKSLWYKNAKAYLPAATDMNHLNALAGTSSAQTGIISVWAQPTGWDKNGEATITRTSMSFARDDKGRPVDTLFHAWKRRWPNSKTMLITGKEWVGEMFRGNGSASSGVDILVTGPNHPDYLKPPQRESLADPHTDSDAACDPESTHLGFFGGSMRPSNVMTRLYTGQGSLLTWQMEHFANHFPHDSWIVDSTLEIFKRHSAEFKAKVALLAIKGEQGVNEIASQHQIHPGQVTQWKKQLVEQLPEIFSHGSRRAARAEDELRDRLYQEIGQLKVELDWLKKKFGERD